MLELTEAITEVLTEVLQRGTESVLLTEAISWEYPLDTIHPICSN